MHKKNFAHIFSLLFLALCCTSALFSQDRPKVKNLPTFDEKKIHFGFSLGINSTNFMMDHDIRSVDTLASVEVVPQSGFNLGIVSDLHLGPYFNLRFIPALSFGQRNVEYSFQSSMSDEVYNFIKPVESTYIDIPINLKYHSMRYNNFAAYVVGGAQYSIDLVSQKDVSNASSNLDDVVLKLDQTMLAAQLGFGFDFYLEYFKFSPEIKMSYGIQNILIQDNTVFSTPIDRLRSKILMISFTFEG